MNYLVLGNWKSNGDQKALTAFLAEFSPVNRALIDGYRTGIAVPYHLIQAGDFGSAWVGAQNVSAFPPGAYTGEITGGMLSELGTQFGLVGHSERRHLMGETVEQTRAKLENLQQSGIYPILCVGETLDERNQGRLHEVLLAQLAALDIFTKDSSFAVAYEPVWAIGTGVAATPADVADAHRFLRETLAERGFGHVPLMYGGSVKPANAAELAAIDDVHGFLVGGASLKAGSFGEIDRAFLEAKNL
ncbi:triose-phosphate isomerase [Acanthopleuribacter pedis]|uniref:Triosephosphate isomerase n=1 Tax=Acanthopleuribacter pedis TaxID=442870 RepID=A0A8J7QRF2_9BACT|nr:triose-phosphate isomerase [Acanthopleuribacter pedis]MBO1322840.1 triose-phosphate isomerase [Acanthopleuribacter pedis]